eukprot:4811478-Pyramimonas_sp.AAC.1
MSYSNKSKNFAVLARAHQARRLNLVFEPPGNSLIMLALSRPCRPSAQPLLTLARHLREAIS